MTTDIDYGMNWEGQDGRTYRVTYEADAQRLVAADRSSGNILPICYLNTADTAARALTGWAERHNSIGDLPWVAAAARAFLNTWSSS